ncbi:hypothetical protein RFI_22388 [Reticulomyxa filosa]|uniref:Uncharacterized protein n=1 Tax=Reticulomyxa filosa TaxID=46433 RepID=X6MPH4_RETFI|nr:hypothetical protein RFI_22388 [Reticulomyxa filosa]|eukprot:ETO14980.1 hypothetical protein RFI_22388 [Reticulomyxa filosa]
MAKKHIKIVCWTKRSINTLNAFTPTHATMDSIVFCTATAPLFGLKKAQYQKAFDDCTICIKLDPNNVKAFIRRNQAALELKRYSEATSDAEKTCQLDSQNPAEDIELILQHLIRVQQIGFGWINYFDKIFINYNNIGNSNVICSGSLDNTIRFWDIRSNKNELYVIEGNEKVSDFKFIDSKRTIDIIGIYVIV